MVLLMEGAAGKILIRIVMMKIPNFCSMVSQQGQTAGLSFS